MTRRFWNTTLRVLWLSLAGGLWMGSAMGQDAPDKAFGLRPPVLVKADKASRLLRIGDMNGDGLQDFITVNNNKSLLQLFTQTDTDGQRGFEKHEEVLENTIDDLCVADLNGDKRLDLAMAARKKNVSVRYQKDDGSLATAAPIEAEGATLVTGDLDRDGRTDLLVLDSDRLSLFWGEKKKEIGQSKPMVFFNAGSLGSRPVVCDLDGNGLDDVAYLDSKRRSRLLVRFQNAPRRWGMESAFEIGDTADLSSVRLGAADKTEGQPALLATTDSKTLEMRVYRLEDAEAGSGVRLPLSEPFFLSLDPRTQSGRESLLACDLRGDGQTALVAASPSAAEMSLYVRNRSGDLDALRVPSLSDVTAMAAIEGRKGALVFSLSDREETIGAASWDASRGLTVPTFLDAERKPLAIAVGDLDGSAQDDILYLFKDQETTLTLAVIADPTSQEDLRNAPTTVTLPGDSDYDPVSMMAADVDGDTRCDLLIFSRYHPLRLLLQTELMHFEPFATDQGMKKGIFNKVRPAQIAIADLDGDGKNEMLIAGESFVRAYRIDADGNLDMVEQMNGKNTSARIESVAAGNLDGEGGPEVVLLDSANKVLTLYARGESGDYELVRHHEADGVRGTRLMMVDADGDDREDLAVYEGDGVKLLYSGQASQKMQVVWRRAPEEKEGKYARVVARAILPDADGEQMLALEGTEHLLEFFTANGEAPERFFHFKIFDDEKSVARVRDLRGRAQPRSIKTVDIDGDGMNDLVVLMHDNIVYYLQFKPETKTE